jgi:radical SAM-linked protein
MIDVGVRREYLLEEWENARSEVLTPDCRQGGCTGCGVCDFEEIYPRVASELNLSGNPVPTEVTEETPRRFRLRYGKTGAAKFLGHQDIIRCFHRAFRRCGLRLDYSKGFHPHPKLRFSPPLAVGIESKAEYLDFDLLECSLSAQAIRDALDKALPEGINPLELQEITFNDRAVSGRIQELTFEVTHFDSVPADEVARKVREFHAASSVELVRIVDGRTKTRNLKEWVTRLVFVGDALEMTLRSNPSGSIHPLDTLSTILSLPRDSVRGMKMVKTSVGLSED